MGWACSTGTYKPLVGRPEGRRLLGRPKLRSEENIKMDIQEVEWEGWTGLIWFSLGTGSWKFREQH